MRPAPVFVVLLLFVTAWPVGTAEAQPSLHYVRLAQEVTLPGGDLTLVVGSDRPGTGAARLYAIDPHEADKQAWRHGSGTLLAQQSVATADAGGTARGEVTFPAVPAGLYRVDVTMGERVRTTEAPVTGLAMLTRSASEESLVWTVDILTGQPVRSTLLLPDGTEATTDGDGVWRGPASGSVVASSPLGPALTSAYGDDDDAGRLGLFTDRSLYRPGQTVHLKLVSLGEDGAPSQEPVHVQVESLGGGYALVATETLEPGPSGTAVVDVVLSEGAGTGHHRVTARRGATYGQTSFEVEAYRVPGLGVDVSVPARVVAGEDAAAVVSASRFSGGPLPGGLVSWSLGPASSCLHCDGGPTLREGEARLGTDGTAPLSLRLDETGRYRLRAWVESSTGERVEDTATFTVVEAAVVPGLPGTTSSVQAGQVVRIPVTLSGLDGEPLDGTVRLRHEQVETLDRDGRPTQARMLATHDVEVRDGRGVVELTVGDDGQQVLVAEATDAAGRTARAERKLYVGDWLPRVGSLSLVSLGMDGQSASFRVVPAQDHPVLVTLEDTGVLDATVVHPGGSPVVTFDTSGARSHKVQAVALQLRTEEGFLPWFEEASARVGVEPRDRVLRVEVLPDRDWYEASGDARMLVRVTDVDGAPVRAEVSLWLVDEALQSLERPGRSLADQLLPPARDGWTLQSLEAYAPDGGDSDGGDGDGDGDGSGGGGGAPADLSVRSLFPETGFWLPAGETDDGGLLRVTATLPDSVTTWDVSAVAVGPTGRFGTGGASLVTWQEVSADLHAPRFLARGDEATVLAAVSNHGVRTRDFLVLLEGNGTEAVGPATRTLTLAPGGTGLVSFPIAAPAAGAADLTLYAWSPDDGVGDAVRVLVPVLAHAPFDGDALRIGRRIVDDAGHEVDALPVGREATVEVTVRSDAAREEVVLDDPLPAGVEVVQERGNGSWSPQAFDDHVHVRLGHMEPGVPERVSYRVRGVWPGTYHVLPTTGEADGEDARGEASRLTVLPRPELHVGRLAVEDGVLRGNVHATDPDRERPEVEVRVDDEPVDVLVQRIDGIWRVQAEVPPGNVSLVARSGDATAAADIVSPRPETNATASVRFRPRDESAWTAGHVVDLSRAGAGLEPDYASVFAGVEADALLALEPRPERGLTGPAAAGILLVLAVAAVVAARRRL